MKKVPLGLTLQEDALAMLQKCLEADHVCLFRAMCKEELDLTLKFNSLQYFRNREKCFSPYLYWIMNVVMNKKFNNSDSKLDRYEYLTCFYIPISEIYKFRRFRLEWKTNVRKQVKVTKIITITRINGEKA